MLTDDDRELLGFVGCLVDAEAVAEAAYEASGSPLTWAETGRPEHEQYRAIAAAALRAAGLTPGEPALHLILEAIEWRVGWEAAVFVARGECRANVYTDDPGVTASAGGDAPATALALAFCAAVRATEGAE